MCEPYSNKVLGSCRATTDAQGVRVDSDSLRNLRAIIQPGAVGPAIRAIARRQLATHNHSGGCHGPSPGVRARRHMCQPTRAADLNQAQPPIDTDFEHVVWADNALAMDPKKGIGRSVSSRM